MVKLNKKATNFEDFYYNVLGGDSSKKLKGNGG